MKKEQVSEASTDISLPVIFTRGAGYPCIFGLLFLTAFIFFCFLFYLLPSVSFAKLVLPSIALLLVFLRIMPSRVEFKIDRTNISITPKKIFSNASSSEPIRRQMSEFDNIELRKTWTRGSAPTSVIIFRSKFQLKRVPWYRYQRASDAVGDIFLPLPVFDSGEYMAQNLGQVLGLNYQRYEFYMPQDYAAYKQQYDRLAQRPEKID